MQHGPHRPHRRMAKSLIMLCVVLSTLVWYRVPLKLLFINVIDRFCTGSNASAAVGGALTFRSAFERALTHSLTQSRSHAVTQSCNNNNNNNATQRNATQRNGLVVDPPRVAVTLPRRHVAATLRRRCGLWLVTCGLWLVTVSCVIRPSSSLLTRAEECRGSSVVADVASLS